MVDFHRSQAVVAYINTAEQLDAYTDYNKLCRSLGVDHAQSSTLRLRSEGDIVVDTDFSHLHRMLSVPLSLMISAVSDVRCTLVWQTSRHASGCGICEVAIS